MRWKRVNLKQGQGPGKIWGHTCNSMGDGRLLYIFGGYGHDGRVTNKVFVFNTGKFKKFSPKFVVEITFE